MNLLKGGYVYYSGVCIGANSFPVQKELISDNNILNFYENAIKNGCYSNMRMLKNDIEDAINYAILKKREIL